MQAKQPQPQPQSGQNAAVLELRQLQKQISDLTDEVKSLKVKVDKGYLSDTVAWGVFKGALVLFILSAILSAFFGML